ncbi:glycerophosphodiester phosphodiesterase [Bacillus sp. AGMB 02131]|uniref:Glycerophosphodiester phosphodiesterase n=2 Tax=Peribacillus faecalis TaxID=2772559 RepID=A0A927HBP7_9BACI|nr:glycerophosphodiester phosphodiesterase [Peribacillus faecalis]
MAMKRYLLLFALLAILFVTIAFIAFDEVEEAVEPSLVNTPGIFAHRGANDRFNESTITAYQIAAEDGVDALEIDLRMTKDGHLVVIHDETIDRTTTGTGEVLDYTLDELKSFQTIADIGDEMTVEEIPTLKELLDTFLDTERYYIETRLVNGELRMEEPLIKLLKESDLLSEELVMIQSFSEKSLQKIQELAPELKLAFLFRKGEFNLEKAMSSDFPIIGLESSEVTMRVVNELHSEGKEVHVFFNDLDTQAEEQRRVKSFNVDGFFTDDILFTKQLLNEME